MHYGRDEITNINAANYRVFIHDKTSLYKVDKPNLSSSGVTGEYTPVLNPDTIKEIDRQHTRKQYKRHLHDLNIYTKTELKTNVILKKADITDISHLKVGVDIADDLGTAAIFGLGVVVWIVIIKSFQGLL
jgi:spore coat polysaccharide biosynthesis protein SpsF (cytidylyltransferase family)